MKDGLKIVPHDRHGKIELLDNIHDKLLLSELLRVYAKLNLLGIGSQKGFEDAVGQIFDVNCWNEIVSVSKDAKLLRVDDTFEEFFEVLFALSVNQSRHYEVALDQLVP